MFLSKGLTVDYKRVSCTTQIL